MADHEMTPDFDRSLPQLIEKLEALEPHIKHIKGIVPRASRSWNIAYHLDKGHLLALINDCNVVLHHAAICVADLDAEYEEKPQ